jgi:HPt (histidine-containing phosphotransfer) domain-containing protein
VPGEGLIFRSEEVPTAALPPPTEAPVALEVVAELRELMGEMGIQPLQQLNEVFVRSAEKHISAMRSALTDGDAAALAREAHRLRGNSASLGAQRMTSVCALIEERSRAGDLAPVGNLLQHLDEELVMYEKAITPILG